MATNQQTFETIVRLNAQEAKNELAALQQNLEVLRKKKADALNQILQHCRDRMDELKKSSTSTMGQYNAEMAKAKQRAKDLTEEIAQSGYGHFHSIGTKSNVQVS